MKADKEIKIYIIASYIKAFYQMPHLRMSFQDWQSSKKSPLEGFEHQLKAKLDQD